MAQIDTDGKQKVKMHLKNPLVSMYDTLSKAGNFNSVKDEFDTMMSLINEMGEWQEPGTAAPEPTVIVNNKPYRPAED